MLKRFPFSFAALRTGMVGAFARFPLVILCGAVGAACGILALHTPNDERVLRRCGDLALTAALGMPLFFSLRIIRERIGRLARVPLELLGVPLLALSFFALRAHLQLPRIALFQWLLMLAALHCIAAISPFIRGAEGIAFWEWNRRLFLRFCLATLHSGVLTVGLELALLSADKLFGLQLGRAYLDLALLMLGCFHPIFFLAGVPRDLAGLECHSEHPPGLKTFTQFALAPLVAIYGALLYAYALTILWQRSWPQGWVALPVLLLSGIGILATLLQHPIRHDVREKWASWSSRNFPRALLPLSVLLLLSLRERITAYGITEPRYLGIVAGAWVFVWCVVYIVRPRTGIRWIPSSLAIVALLVAFGPWSAGAVSTRSQRSRLIAILQQHGLWAGDRAKRAEQRVDVPGKAESSLANIIAYLIDTHGSESVRDLFASVVNIDWPRLSGLQTSDHILTSLNVRSSRWESFALSGTDRTEPPSVDVPTRLFLRDTRTSVDLDGFHRMWRFSEHSGSGIEWRTRSINDVAVGLDRGVLKIATAEAPDPAPLPFTETLAGILKARANDLPAEQLTIDFTHAGRSFRVIFESLHVRGGDTPRFTGFDLYLFER
ncbi:MAG: DUF4153 domain-containing protein [Chthoniobacterales bacterium]